MKTELTVNRRRIFFMLALLFFLLLAAAIVELNVLALSFDVLFYLQKKRELTSH